MGRNNQSPDVDREVVKYLLFHELLHANGYLKHDDKFRNREWQYPNSDELDGFLDELSIRYDMKDIWNIAVRTEKYLEDGSVEQISYKVESDKIIEEDNTSSIDLAKEEISVKEDISSDEHFNPSAKGVMTGYKYCRNCGHKVPESAKFCDKCGERMDY